MIPNYFKTSIRHMKKYKSYTLINVVGLAVGMAVCLLILLWVADELSFDRYHENKDRIYRLCVDLEAGSHMVYPMTMPSAALYLIDEYPEIENAVRIERPHRVSVRYKNQVFYEIGVCHGDNSIFEVFTIPFIKGDPKTALLAPYTVVITESMFNKYFKDEDPIGKILRINGDHEYAVTGVVKDIPKNSHFRFNMVCSYKTLYSQNRTAMENWFHIQFYTYLLFAENVDISQFEQKLPSFIKKHMASSLKSIGGSLEMFLQPLTKIHLYSSLGGEIAPQGDIAYVYLFAGIAFFVLIIACINFINLATARSSVRSLEIGMRKTLGASKGRLALQFFTETTLYSLLSLVFAIVLVNISLPQLVTVFNRELSFDIVNPWELATGVICLTVIVGILAGCYPSIYLSNIQSIGALKGGLKTGAYRSRFRDGLVVVQFAVSIILIIATITIAYQIRFMKHKNLGFEKENILVIPQTNQVIQKHTMTTIRKYFMDIPGIIDVGGSSLVPSRGIQRAILFPEGYSENQPQMGEKLFVDAHYISTVGIELASGRNYSEELASDPSESIIINETAAKQFSWANPIGKSFTIRSNQGIQSEKQVLRVIGVVRDFHSGSLHRKIEPLVFYYDTSRINFLVLRFSFDNINNLLETIGNKWDELAPNRPFDFFFLDESLDLMYRTEERLEKIALSFCFLAIFVGCLGLFGLSAFIVEQRTKEIGIRKVMGATNKNIIQLVSKEFLILIFISNFVAWPTAYLGLNRWLQNFAYQAGIGWWIFLLAGFIGLFIALSTVGFQAIKAARTNPVDSLQYE